MTNSDQTASAIRTVQTPWTLASRGSPETYQQAEINSGTLAGLMGGITCRGEPMIIHLGSKGGVNFEGAAPLGEPIDQFRADDMFARDDWVISGIVRESHWPSDSGGGIGTQTDPVKVPTPVVKATQLPRVGTSSAPRRYTPLQQWEGLVCKIGQETFWADLCDLTDPEAPRESAEIYWDEVPEADRPLVEIGSVFYWTIGYNHGKGGQLERTSEIRLRRLAKWSKKDIDAANRKAEELLKQLEANAAV